MWNSQNLLYTIYDMGKMQVIGVLRSGILLIVLTPNLILVLPNRKYKIA